MTRHLAVLLDGTYVADVEHTRAGALQLRYRDTVTTPLSLSLPRTVATHTGARVERFLRALLPDAPGALRAVADQTGADVADPLSLLAVVGADCPGAVQLCLPDQVEATSARPGTLAVCTDAQIEMRLAALEMNDDPSWLMPGEHWSLGGTQAKFALRRQGGRWYTAHGAEPTTHIVKPGVRGLAHQALVEHISMRAAAHLGLAVAHTEMVSFLTEDAVVVTRFDRATDPDGTVRRLHQEDACQALGVWQKYEEHGGPSAADIIGLLRDSSRTAAQAQANVGRFTDALIVNTVLGAPDAHARNYAVLLAGDDVRLAPLFDVASGLAYDRTSGSPLVGSMSIGGTVELGAIDSAAWRRFADQTEQDATLVLGRVRTLAEVVPAAVERALDETDADGVRELRSRLLPRLRAHVAPLLR